jgi:hypothetical protein
MPTLSRSIRLTKGKDGGVLLDVRQGAIFTLNPVGVRILELLEQEQTTASIVSQISCEFRASRHMVSGDVTSFLQLLHEQGLLRGTKDADHDARF